MSRAGHYTTLHPGSNLSPRRLDWLVGQHPGRCHEASPRYLETHQVFPAVSMKPAWRSLYGLSSGGEMLRAPSRIARL